MKRWWRHDFSKGLQNTLFKIHNKSEAYNTMQDEHKQHPGTHNSPTDEDNEVLQASNCHKNW